MEVARAAWQRGDFHACLEILGADALPADGGVRVEVVLLRARALLRADRPRDARDFLRTHINALPQGDARDSALMLYGSAVARTNGPDAGLAIIDRIRAAHPAIRAEIAYYRALALRQARRFADADAAAVDGARANADVIAARCIALRAWLALDVREYPRALGLFYDAGAAIRASRELDVHLCALVESTIAMVELDLRGATFVGRHRERYRADAGAAAFLPATAAPIQRLLNRVFDAWAFALDGDATCALDRIWECMLFADALDSDAWRVYALAERAAVLRAIGELATSRKFADEAADLAESVAWAQTQHEERFALLTLAGELARYDTDRAVACMERYRATQQTSSIDGLLAHTPDNPRLTASEDAAAGVIARELGETQNALHLLRRAFKAYRSLGIEWRAVVMLAELADVDAPCAPGARAAVVRLAQSHFPRAFMLGALPGSRDPVRATLPAALRDILDLLCAEKSIDEIATLRGRAVSTVRSQVKEIRRRYGVRTQRALVARCAALA